jgi:hypothetical protein
VEAAYSGRIGRARGRLSIAQTCLGAGTQWKPRGEQ